MKTTKTEPKNPMLEIDQAFQELRAARIHMKKCADAARSANKAESDSEIKFSKAMETFFQQTR